MLGVRDDGMRMMEVSSLGGDVMQLRMRWFFMSSPPIKFFPQPSIPSAFPQSTFKPISARKQIQHSNLLKHLALTSPLGEGLAPIS